MTGAFGDNVSDMIYIFMILYIYYIFI